MLDEDLEEALFGWVKDLHSRNFCVYLTMHFNSHWCHFNTGLILTLGLWSSKGIHEWIHSSELLWYMLLLVMHS